MESGAKEKKGKKWKVNIVILVCCARSLEHSKLFADAEYSRIACSASAAAAAVVCVLCIAPTGEG